ncbi:tripartite tricarboxylate transporter substrate binding protein [Belnapia sp. T6]|uniref:Tripartite tricarboxylate transporter substrate binding protein n=1 Tax=Belnapia mucosa TaxID=2804532 RepID=A0ABS1V165_9PROT|nr:tripartite tricarboxylate transporter substrate binding protein [Belnapia mucosa]MBL6454028.1 tripartite tricarboxylate transporter substrate binding protein [Belnapia mucosa]
MRRRALIGGGLVLAAPRILRAQSDWPGNRPVRLIQPSQAGSPADVYARLLAEHFARVFGGTFVVENRVGGTGSIGTAAVAAAPADGWTLLFTSNTSHVVAPLVLRGLPYDPVKDFVAIAGLYHYPMLLIVTPTIPARTTAEFVAWARARPGGVNMASVGIGSVGHMMAERFHLRAGFRREHIPYRGGPSAVLAVSQGESDYIFDNIGNSGALLREGRLRGLAATGRARPGPMPEVPTLAEEGYPGFTEDVWFGIWGAAGLPRPFVERINAEANRWLDTPDIRRRMAEAGHESLAGPPEAMHQYWMEDRRGWVEIVRETGVTVE